MALEVRRIVTGHDSQGKAVVATDEHLAGTGAAGRAGISRVDVWSTDTRTRHAIISLASSRWPDGPIHALNWQLRAIISRRISATCAWHRARYRRTDRSGRRQSAGAA